ncbi:MAG: hypothetical protein HYX27_00005 [Acidobacteria bacterium]|nr:hypothetical protein [Acidobacteriota bacterium]
MPTMEEFREMAKRNYNFYSWPPLTSAAVPGRRPFLLDPLRLEGYTHLGREAFPGVANAWRDRFAQDAYPDLFYMVTVHVHGTHAETHDAMLDALNLSMSPRLPRSEEAGIQVGDICFAGHGAVQSRLLFARGTVLVDVCAMSGREYPVEDLAYKIDNQILESLR